ncbi:unnamed protein product [Nyctereutes procyonoides]|uniref:(raccoon dog) hypothetical protein n=1 Tax=Nyctereutes procyonoides TaxID=34880 RepID=A0A811YYS6_NYCPR|nr:unnamed protein product [Nyctereutes procyonoides]
MENEGYQETQSKEVQNDKIGSSSNEMMAEEPEVVLISVPQVQAPPECLDADSVEDLETMPQGILPTRQDVLRHLQELAGQWLRPDIHTKEQIVEMLVQEQFQAILPEELRARAQRCQPGVRITD